MIEYKGLVLNSDETPLCNSFSWRPTKRQSARRIGLDPCTQKAGEWHEHNLPNVSNRETADFRYTYTACYDSTHSHTQTSTITTNRDTERLTFKEKEALILELVEVKQQRESLALEIDSVPTPHRLFRSFLLMLSPALCPLLACAVSRSFFN
jgi:hypothetical protein